MKLKYKFINIEARDTLQKYLEAKFSKNYLDKIAATKMSLTVTKQPASQKFLVSLSGKDLFVKKSHKDFYVCANKVLSAVQKFCDKRNFHNVKFSLLKHKIIVTAIYCVNMYINNSTHDTTQES